MKPAQIRSRALLLAAAWSPALVTAASGVVLVVLLTRGVDGAAAALGLGPPTLAFSIVGGVLAHRRPDSPVGWMLGLYGSTFLADQAALVWAQAAAADQALALNAVPLWLSSWLWAVGIGVLGTVLQLFPDGRPATPRWRLGVAVGLTGIVAVLVAAVLAWDGRAALGATATFEGYRGAAAVAASIGQVGIFGSVPIAVASLAVRYRSGRRIEQLQIRWLLWGCGLYALSSLLFAIGEPPDSPDASLVVQGLAFAGLTLIPLSIGVAVLRYRLYEIDRIISRTATYALVSATLVAVYALVAVVPSAVFDLESDLLVAAATLVAAAAFGPVRRLVQRWVDRRFDRARYDAARVIAGFAGRLRDELDLADLRSDLGAVVRRTMRPAHVSLWIPDEDGR